MFGWLRDALAQLLPAARRLLRVLFFGEQPTSEGSCPVCLEDYGSGPEEIRTSCGHSFCIDCLVRYAASSPPPSECPCPLCRRLVHLRRCTYVQSGIEVDPRGYAAQTSSFSDHILVFKCRPMHERLFYMSLALPVVCTWLFWSGVLTAATHSVHRFGDVWQGLLQNLHGVSHVLLGAAWRTGWWVANHAFAAMWFALKKTCALFDIMYGISRQVLDAVCGALAPFHHIWSALGASLEDYVAPLIQRLATEFDSLQVALRMGARGLIHGAIQLLFLLGVRLIKVLFRALEWCQKDWLPACEAAYDFLHNAGQVARSIVVALWHPLWYMVCSTATCLRAAASLATVSIEPTLVRMRSIVQSIVILMSNFCAASKDCVDGLLVPILATGRAMKTLVLAVLAEASSIATTLQALVRKHATEYADKAVDVGASVEVLVEALRAAAFAFASGGGWRSKQA